MKTLLMILICAFSFTLQAQISVGLKAGLTPEVRPGTAHVFVNRDDPRNEFLFNSERVRYTPTVGLQVRLDRGQKWFSAELLAYGWKEQYSVSYMTRSESDGVFAEEKYVVELPISIGVTLGRFEVSSGFSAAQTISQKTDLTAIDGYSSSTSMRRFGWHTGVGVNISNFRVNLRYAQYFCNYGEKRNINGYDLTLRNAPARLLASVTFTL